MPRGARGRLSSWLRERRRANRRRNRIEKKKIQRRSGIASIFSFDKSHYIVKGSFRKTEICVDTAMRQSTVSGINPPHSRSCAHHARGTRRRDGEAKGCARCQRVNIFISRSPSSILQPPTLQTHIQDSVLQAKGNTVQGSL